MTPGAARGAPKPPAGPGLDELAKDRQFVTALARGLEVLRAFQAGGGQLGNQEIARRTNLPKPTVSRLTHTLTRLGYLVHDERIGKYRTGPGVLALGQSSLMNMGLLRVARPYMQELRAYSHASIAIATRDRLEIVYLENISGDASIGLRLEAGARLPMGTTAAGRAYLAALPEGERAFLMGHLEKLHRARWPGVRDGIARAVDEIATRGYTVVAGEWQREVAAVGAPIVVPGGLGLAVMTAGAPSFVIGRARLEREVGPRLASFVQAIETELENA